MTETPPVHPDLLRHRKTLTPRIIETTPGVGGLLEEEPDGGAGVAIVGHPHIPRNLERARTPAHEAYRYRVRMENGSLLPREGERSVHAPAPVWTGRSPE